MAKNLLYQLAAIPPRQPGTETYTASTFQRWSEPVRPKIAPRLAVALVASGLFAPIPIIAPTAVAPETHSSEVIFSRSFIYQSQAYTPFTPAATTTATVVPTNWNNPPPQRKVILYQSKAYAPFTPERVTVDKWFEPLSEPTRRKSWVSLQSSTVLGFPTEIVTLDKWFEPWNDPTRRKVSVAFQPASVLGFPTEIVTVDKWFKSLDEPTRRKVSVASQPTSVLGFPPEVVTVDKWFEPLAEPNRRKRSIDSQQSYNPFVTAAEIITEDKWHQPWSEPKRFKRPVAQQQDLAWSGFTPVTSTAVGPETHSSEVIYSRSIIYQSQAYAPFTPTETVTVDKWFEPLSEPTRRKPGTALQQSVAFVAQTEVVTVDKWFKSWDEPSRRKTSVASQPSAVSIFQTEVVTVDKWFEPLSEPSRRKKTTPQQDIATPYAPITPAFTFFPMVEGDTGLLFQKTIIYQISAESETPAGIFWDHPWAEPMRAKVSFARYPYEFWSTFTPAAAPVVTAVEPTSIISQVIYPRSIIYQSVAWAPYPIAAEVITVDKWFESWTDPKRFKKGMRADEQQFLAQPPIFPNLVRIIPWYEPLSEPVRTRTLKASLQSTVAFPVQPPPAVTVTLTMSAFEINADRFFAVIQTSRRAVKARVSIHQIPAIDGAAVSIEET